MHKFLGYLLALQLLFWLLGGLIMSVLPLNKVHGDHLVNRQLTNPFSEQHYQYSLDKLRKKYQSIQSISYTFFLNTPVYHLKTLTTTIDINATTGKILTTPSEAEIITQAKKHYRNNYQVKSVIPLEKAPAEAKNTPKVWAVNFDDNINTTLYFSQQSGQLLTVRSDIWRLFDFVWMLHIMDYQDRENFNNPLLILSASSAVLFCLSGIFLLFQRFSSNQRNLVKKLTNKFNNQSL